MMDPKMEPVHNFTTEVISDGKMKNPKNDKIICGEIVFDQLQILTPSW